MWRLRATGSLLVGLALLAVVLSAPASAGAEGPAASLYPSSPVVAVAGAHSGTAAQVVAGGPDQLSAQFIGFVYRDDDGRLATRIRATGMTDRGEAVNCGSAPATALDSGFGFYQVLVLSDAAREGCPKAGQPVTFRLLFGNVDDGVRAVTSNDTTFSPGATSVVTLYPSADHSIANRWTGDTSTRVAQLTWIGTEGTRIESALAALGRPVVGAWRWDAAASQYEVYVPGGSALRQSLEVVSPGDVVTVRFE